MNRQQLAAQLRRQARRLGWIGGGGVLLAALAALELLNVTLPAREQAVQLAERSARLADASRSGKPIQPARGGDAVSQLEAFEAHFPPRAELNITVAKIHAIAQTAGVELLRGEYQIETEKSLGVTRYQMNLPITGAYPGIKNFVRGVLKDIPSAALDGISLQRKGPGEDALEAIIRFSLYAREDAGAARAAATPTGGSAP